MELNEKLKEVKIPRNQEAKIFEAVTFLIVAFSVFIGIWLLISGRGDRLMVAVCLGTGAFLPFLLLVCCYTPSLLNVPVRITTPRQLFEVVRMTRVVSVELAVMFFFMMIGTAMPGSQTGFFVGLSQGIGVFVLLLTLAFFCFRIFRMR